MAMKKPGGYLRVSEQNRKGYSLESQCRAIRDLCQQKGWDLKATYTEESGSTTGEDEREG